MVPRIKKSNVYNLAAKPLVRRGSAVLIYSLLALSASSQPVCTLVSPADTDFGFVAVGSTQIHYFTLANLGDQVLEIWPHEQSCGCQILSLPISISPGSEYPLEVAFRIDTHGIRSESVTVKTNDPTSPTLALTISYTGVREIYAAPSEISITEVLDLSYPLTVKLKAADDLTFRITGVNTTSSCIKLLDKTVPKGQASNIHTFQVLITPLVSGTLQETLTFRTDSPAVPIIEVPVIGRVRGLYSVEPDQLLFGISKPGEKVTAEVQISSNTSTPFTLSTLRPISTEELQVVAAAPTSVRENQVRWRVLLTFCVPESRGFWTKNWPLTITSSPAEEFTILVSAAGLVR